MILRIRGVVLFGFFFSLLLPLAAEDSRRFRVMSWNLEDMDLFDGDGAGRVSWQEDADNAIAQSIREIDPDYLLIVEAPSFVELEVFVEHHGLDYRVSHVRQQVSRRDFADAMALLSKDLPLNVSLVTPPVPGSTRAAENRYQDWSYRGLLVAEFPGLNFIGVHLKSPYDGRERSYLTREAQIRGLLNYMDTVSGTVVVAGDFNDSPGRDSKEEQFNLVDSLSLLDSEFIRATGEDATQQNGFNIDHIYVRDGAVGPRTTLETDWNISDHRPVWADVLVY